MGTGHHLQRGRLQGNCSLRAGQLAVSPQGRQAFPAFLGQPQSIGDLSQQGEDSQAKKENSQGGCREGGGAMGQQVVTAPAQVSRATTCGLRSP